MRGATHKLFCHVTVVCVRTQYRVYVAVILIIFYVGRNKLPFKVEGRLWKVNPLTSEAVGTLVSST